MMHFSCREGREAEEDEVAAFPGSPIHYTIIKAVKEPG